MSLKDKLQDLSKNNSESTILFNEFSKTIENELEAFAKLGKTDYKIPYKYNKIIEEIGIWVKNRDLTLRTYTEGHAQTTGYSISWKD